MKGFIRNETDRAIFKLQRPLPINGTLSFENAYLTLGAKSGKKRGVAFVKWLQEHHFADEGWVFYKEEGVPFFPVAPEEKKEVVSHLERRRSKKITPAGGAGKRLAKKNDRVSNKKATAGLIIDADIELAKGMIESTKDRAILKRALSLSNHFSHREEHRRLIQRRLEEVY